jgi:hypothetical protein
VKAIASINTVSTVLSINSSKATEEATNSVGTFQWKSMNKHLRTTMAPSYFEISSTPSLEPTKYSTDKSARRNYKYRIATTKPKKKILRLILISLPMISFCSAKPSTFRDPPAMQPTAESPIPMARAHTPKAEETAN